MLFCFSQGTNLYHFTRHSKKIVILTPFDYLCGAVNFQFTVNDTGKIVYQLIV